MVVNLLFVIVGVVEGVVQMTAVISKLIGTKARFDGFFFRTGVDVPLEYTVSIP